MKKRVAVDGGVETCQVGLQADEAHDNASQSAPDTFALLLVALIQPSAPSPLPGTGRPCPDAEFHTKSPCVHVPRAGMDAAEKVGTATTGAI
jgi:hypothetical protein